jgi:hypothetical protein
MEMSALLLRKKIHKIQLERSIANEKHEQETVKYKKRLSGMTTKLYSATHYYRVYFYFQSLQLSSDNVSPFVIQRQAILCAMLHKEEILSRQTRVLQLYQEKLIKELDSFRTLIDDEFSATSKSLTMLIMKLTSEINILEARKQSIVHVCKPNEEPTIHDGESGYFSEMFKKLNFTKRSVATVMQRNTSSYTLSSSNLRNPSFHESERVGVIANVA